LEIASMAYSTWYRRPSGLKIVVRLSYLRAMLPADGYALLWLKAVCALPDRYCPADGALQQLLACQGRT
jgi:hypothetical protein